MRIDLRIAAAAAIGITSLLTACADDNVGSLRLVARWPPKPAGSQTQESALVLPASVTTLTVSVSGPGMGSPLVQSFDLTALDTDVVRVERIPAGKARVVEVRGLDSDGFPTLSGTGDPVEIVAGKTAKAVVTLAPAPGMNADTGEATVFVVINGGATDTANADVNVRVVGSDLAEMALTNAPPGYADYDALAFEPYTAAEVSWTLDIASGDGQKRVYVVVRDAAGNASRPIASDPILLDTTGPVVHQNLVLVGSNPPGSNDTVAGAAGSVEAGSLIEVFADSSLTSVVASGSADVAGSFAALSIGDNFTDQTSANQGQTTFWVRATDALGNTGAPVTVDTDMTPPPIELVLENGHPYFARANAHLQVRVSSPQVLAAPPTLAVVGASAPPAHPTALACSGYDPVTFTYTCSGTTTGEDTEGSADLVIMAVEEGAENVAQVTATAGVLFDYTNPTEVLIDGDVLVESNPTGTDDRISVPAGKLPPFGWLVLYSASPAMCSIPPSCGSYDEYARFEADATGGLASTSIGDNAVGNFRARILDPAGNDRCDPTCLDSVCVPGVCCMPCCGMGGTTIGDCAGYDTGCNDVVGPQVSLAVAPAVVSNTTSARFLFDLSDQTCGAPTAPSAIYCRLDGEAFAICPATLTRTVSLGAHRLEYYAVDPLDNRALDRDGVPLLYAHGWRVQTRTTVVDGTSLDDLTHKGYLIDDASKAHVFIGGDRLRHFYETTTNVFASEILVDSPVDHVVALRAGSTIHVAYTIDGGRQIELKSGTTASFSTEVVATGTRVLNDGLDIALDEQSRVNLMFNTPPSPEAWYMTAYLTTRTVPGLWSAPEAVSLEYVSNEERLVFNASGDVWAAWFEFTGNSFGDFYNSSRLLTRPRVGGVWQTPQAIAGTTGNYSDDSQPRYPTIARRSDGNPVLTYREGYHDSSPVKLVAYNSTSWGAPLDLTYLGHTAVDTSGGSLWYAMSGPTTSATLGLQRYYDSGGGSWVLDGTTLAAFGQRARRVSLAVRTAGTIGTAVVDVGYTYGDLEELPHLGRSVLNGTSPMSLLDGEAITAASFVRGAPVPTAVVRLAGSARVLWLTYDGTANAWAATNVLQDPTRGAGAVGVQNGTTAWVVHGDPRPGQANNQLYVERRPSSTWASLGAITSGSGVRDLPSIGLLSDGNPVVAYRLKSAGNTSVMTTWYDGSGFVAPTELISLGSDSVASIAVIGDHNGAAGGGDLWVACGVAGTSEVRIVKVNLAGQNLTLLPCESCVNEVVTTLAGGPPGVTAALSPSGEPTLIAASETRWSSYYNYGVVRMAVYSGGAWQVADLNHSTSPDRAFIKQKGVPGTGWADATDQTVQTAAYYYAPVALAFDSAGRLRLGLAIADEADPYQADAVLDHYAVAVEQASGDFKVYGIWPLQHSNNVRPQLIDVAVDTSDRALVIWSDTAMADLLSLRQDAL
jgi:hypothetical protein